MFQSICSKAIRCYPTTGFFASQWQHSTSVPPKNYKHFIAHRTKGFCSIIKFSFDLNRKYYNLDFETKFAQIRFDLTEIRKCHIVAYYSVQKHCENQYPETGKILRVEINLSVLTFMYLSQTSWDLSKLALRI